MEIQQERARHQASENSLQGRITQYVSEQCTSPLSLHTHTYIHTLTHFTTAPLTLQLNEQQVTRTKIAGLEEELKQTKALPTSHAMQQLQEVRS